MRVIRRINDVVHSCLRHLIRREIHHEIGGGGQPAPRPGEFRHEQAVILVGRHHAGNHLAIGRVGGLTCNVLWRLYIEQKYQDESRGCGQEPQAQCHQKCNQHDQGLQAARVKAAVNRIGKVGNQQRGQEQNQRVKQVPIVVPAQG